MNNNKTSVNRFNFHMSTVGVFKQIMVTGKLSNPDYVSKSGSKYWFVNERLYRYSNHWGEVSSCLWSIKGRINAPKNYKLGVVRFKDLSFYSRVDFDKLMPKSERYVCGYKHRIKSHLLSNDPILLKTINCPFLISHKKIKIEISTCLGISTGTHSIKVLCKNDNMDLTMAFFDKIDTIILELLIHKESMFDGMYYDKQI